MAKLKIIKGENAGESYSLKEQCILGRSAEADLIIKDLRASRKHACLSQIEGQFYVDDLHSQNGTFVNGRKIKKRTPINNDENIRIGNTWLTLIIEEEALKPGGRFAGYRIIAVLSEEQGGTIYRARQQTLEREVLLWVLPFEAMEQTAEQMHQARQLFISQISQIAGLFHPNLTMVMDFAASERYFYCSFEYLDLKAHVADYLHHHGSLEVDKVLDIAIQVAQGMKYAHASGVLHLNLTSKNILIHEGQYDRVVISQFGVSRFLSETTVSTVTKTTGVLGVSEYVAPEQITGQCSPAAPTDIYSFGCLLYHLLAAQPPFQASKPYDLARLHVEADPRPLEEMISDLPPELATLVTRCMQKEAPARPQNFDEILTALTAIKEQRSLARLLASENGQRLLKQHLGERVVKLWWLLLPAVAVILAAFIFCLTPALAG